MIFSTSAWARNAALYATIRDMPFNRDLADGTLPLATFRRYIVQDAHYLVAFAQALAMAAAKADDPDAVVQFAAAAGGAIAVERELHTGYFQDFGLSPGAVAATAMSPACHHYASFLTATAFREPYPVLLAALLPCFWVYREVGATIMTAASPDNPYAAWIATYGGEDFSNAVDRMIASTDRAADTAATRVVDAMHAAFTRAAQLEWMFWDSAYRDEHWPV